MIRYWEISKQRRRFRVFSVIAVLSLFLLLACSSAQQTESKSSNQLGKGINLGNALEAPVEGQWGITLQENYFKVIAEAGFDTVRVPIMFSAHTQDTHPYTIDETFLERIDWVVEQSAAHDLQAILVLHNFDEISEDPFGQLERFLAIWRQIATRYQDAGEHIYFELLNEPKAKLTEDPSLWNNILVQGIKVIRESNPTRPIVIGPVGWNSLWYLKDFELPDDDNLIATVHFYDPFTFTHQGAEWVDTPPPVGETWAGDQAELAAPWKNWSWDTEFNIANNNSLEVDFSAGWAGLYLHSDTLQTTYNSLKLETDKAMNFLVVCSHDGIPDAKNAIQTKANQSLQVRLEDCGLTQGLRDLAILNNSDAAQDAFRFTELQLCDEQNNCNSIVSTKVEAIAKALDVAKAWSTENNIELFLGEFGVYDPADMPSRILWTEAVRSEAEKRGFSWAYWEFAAGFGVYDPIAETWREGLLTALIEE